MVQEIWQPHILHIKYQIKPSTQHKSQPKEDTMKRAIVTLMGGLMATEAFVLPAAVSKGKL